MSVTIVRRMPASVRYAIAGLLEWGRGVAEEVGAIGPDDPRARAFGSFGDGSAILWPHGVLYNQRYVQIGEQTMIGPNTAITAGMAPTQEMPTNPVVSIGSRCIIGRGSHIVGHWSIQIGDDIMTGPYVYITDQNHTYDDVDQPIGRQWPVEAAVRIGSGSWIGTNAVILPGTTIGENVVVAAGAVVSGTFPSRCVIGGVPAKILKHYDEQRGWVSGAPKVLESEGSDGDDA